MKKNKSSQLHNDLTKGNVAKKLVIYSLPFLISTFAQAFLSLVDLLIIGINGKDAAIAGVGVGGQLYILIISLIIGLSLGSSIIISQHYGAGKREEMQKTIDNVFSLFIVISIVITALVIIFINPILNSIKTPTEAFLFARLYILISAIGIPFTFVFNGLISIIRGMGDSKHPMYIIVISVILNTILNLLFVFTFNFGVVGIASATVISQIMSVIISIIFIKRKKALFAVKLFKLSFDKCEIKQILKIGIPTAIQNSVATLSFFIIANFVNRIGGNDAVYTSSASAIVAKYNSFAILPSRAFSMAISAMVAQNVGKSAFNRVKKTFALGFLLTMIFGVIFAGITLMFSTGIFIVFNCSGKVIDYGLPFLKILSVDYLILPLATSLYGIVNGYGKTYITMIASILTSLVLRVPLAYILGISMNLGLLGIGLAMPISTLFSAIFIGLIVLAKRKQLRLR